MLLNFSPNWVKGSDAGGHNVLGNGARDEAQLAEGTAQSIHEEDLCSDTGDKSGYEQPAKHPCSLLSIQFTILSYTSSEALDPSCGLRARASTPQRHAEIMGTPPSAARLALRLSGRPIVCTPTFNTARNGPAGVLCRTSKRTPACSPGLGISAYG